MRNVNKYLRYDAKNLFTQRRFDRVWAATANDQHRVTDVTRTVRDQVTRRTRRELYDPLRDGTIHDFAEFRLADISRDKHHWVERQMFDQLWQPVVKKSKVAEKSHARILIRDLIDRSTPIWVQSTALVENLSHVDIVMGRQ